VKPCKHLYGEPCNKVDAFRPPHPPTPGRAHHACTAGPGLTCLPLNPACTGYCLGTTYCLGGADGWVASPSHNKVANKWCGSDWQGHLCIISTKNAKTDACNGGSVLGA
jgi:hypothetical protein